jgi:RNA polymerase sigma-70 factor, ECF subfamily
VQGADPDGSPSPERRREIVAAFTAAARGGDLDLLIEVLAPDVVLNVEGAHLSPITVEGAAAVSNRALLFGDADTRSEVVAIDGSPALITWRGATPVAAMQLEFHEDRIGRIRLTVDPVEIARWIASATRDRI